MLKIKSVYPDQLNQWMQKNEAVLLDVREIEEFSANRIPGAINIPLSQISYNDIYPYLESGKKIVIQCRSGVRSLKACEIFSAQNPEIEIWNLEGGILAWNEKGFPIESS